MGIKNTPVQVLEDCGIISLLRDDHTGLQTCIDSLIRFGAGNTGADFCFNCFLYTIKIVFDSFDTIVFAISIHTLKTCTRRN